MNSECSICFEIVRSNEAQKPFVTRCGHLFHENCIKNCLQNKSQGKCPQCNQPAAIPQLIRLFINEPENSVRAKDELIEQLKSQLIELNEKAQLQYDLIGALNRQISLEKELSRKANPDSHQPQNSGSTCRPIIAPQRLLAAANYNAQKLVDSEDIQRRFSVASGSSTKPFSNFATESFSQATFGSSNIFGNRNDKSAVKAKFTFGDAKINEILEACGPIVPTTWPAIVAADQLKATSTQNQLSNPFTFGSNAIPSNWNRSGFKFASKDSSELTSAFDRGFIAATQIPSSSQNSNIFFGLQPKENAAKPSFSVMPTSSTDLDARTERISGSKLYVNWRNTRECSPSNSHTTMSDGLKFKTGKKEPGKLETHEE